MRTHLHLAHFAHLAVRAGASFAALSLALFAAPSAHAQQAEDPSAIAAARNLGVEGVRLADAGRCEDAVPKLERAEKLHHAPTTLGRLGECQIALGKLVLGSELLQRVVREQLPQSAPSAFVSAKTRAKRALDDVLPRIAKLHLRIEAPANVKPKVTLDGDALSTEWIDIDRPIDPGSHTVVASAEGHVDASSTVKLAEGERSEVTLTLTPVPEPPPEPPPPPPAAEVQAPPPRVPEPSAPKPAPALASDPAPSARHTLGLVMLGTSGAAVLFGSIFGLMALDTKHQLDGACGPGKGCPVDQQDEISSLKTQSVLSTVGFITAGATLTAGVVLLLTEPSGSPSSSSSARGSAMGTGRASGLSIGPTSVSWQGRF